MTVVFTTVSPSLPPPLPIPPHQARRLVYTSAVVAADVGDGAGLGEILVSGLHAIAAVADASPTPQALSVHCAALHSALVRCSPMVQVTASTLECLVECYGACGELDGVRAVLAFAAEHRIMATPRLCCGVLTAFSRRSMGLDAIKALRGVEGWTELATVSSVAVLLIEVYVIAGMVSGVTGQREVVGGVGGDRVIVAE